MIRTLSDVSEENLEDSGPYTVVTDNTEEEEHRTAATKDAGEHTDVVSIEPHACTCFDGCPIKYKPVHRKHPASMGDGFIINAQCKTSFFLKLNGPAQIQIGVCGNSKCVHVLHLGSYCDIVYHMQRL